MARQPHPEPDPAIVERLRAICMALPGVVEERAWIGWRWCVAGKNFAHVLTINAGRPAAYAEAAGGEGIVLTFRSPLPELNPFAFPDPPYFKPPWFPDIVGLRMSGDDDWDEIEAALVASWRHLAPRKLHAARSSQNV